MGWWIYNDKWVTEFNTKNGNEDDDFTIVKPKLCKIQHSVPVSETSLPKKCGFGINPDVYNANHTWFVDFQYYQPAGLDKVYPKEMSVLALSDGAVETTFICIAAFILKDNKEEETVEHQFSIHKVGISEGTVVDWVEKLKTIISPNDKIYVKEHVKMITLKKL